jgi:hypothetical protein
MLKSQLLIDIFENAIEASLNTFYL